MLKKVKKKILDPPRNVLGSFLAHASINFHGNPPISFCAILLKDKQTNKQTNKQTVKKTEHPWQR